MARLEANLRLCPHLHCLRKGLDQRWDLPPCTASSCRSARSRCHHSPLHPCSPAQNHRPPCWVIYPFYMHLWSALVYSLTVSQIKVLWVSWQGWLNNLTQALERTSLSPNVKETDVSMLLILLKYAKYRCRLRKKGCCQSCDVDTVQWQLKRCTKSRKFELINPNQERIRTSISDRWLPESTCCMQNKFHYHTRHTVYHIDHIFNYICITLHCIAIQATGIVFAIIVKTSEIIFNFQHFSFCDIDLLSLLCCHRLWTSFLASYASSS